MWRPLSPRPSAAVGAYDPLPESGYRDELSGLRFVDWDQRSAPGLRLGYGPRAGLFPGPQERRPPRAAFCCARTPRGTSRSSNALGADIRPPVAGRCLQARAVPSPIFPADGSKRWQPGPRRACGPGPDALEADVPGRVGHLARMRFAVTLARPYARGTWGGDLSYIAVLAQSPFMESPLAGSRSPGHRRDCRAASSRARPMNVKIVNLKRLLRQDQGGRRCFV